MNMCLIIQKKHNGKALESDGFTEKLTYIQPNEQNQNNRETKKKRKRKSIRFNPLFI